MIQSIGGAAEEKGVLMSSFAAAAAAVLKAMDIIDSTDGHYDSRYDELDCRRRLFRKCKGDEFAITTAVL